MYARGPVCYISICQKTDRNVRQDLSDLCGRRKVNLLSLVSPIDHTALLPRVAFLKMGLPSIRIPVQLWTKLAQQLHPGEGFVSLLCRVGAGSTSAHSAVPRLLSRLLLLQSRSAATSAPRLLAVGRSPQGKCACRRWAAPRETSTCSTAAWLPITNR